MNHAFLVTSKLATMVNYETGAAVSIPSTDSRFAQFVAMVKAGNYARAASLVDVKEKLKLFSFKSKDSKFSVQIRDGQAYYAYANQGEYKLENAIIKRICQMVDENVSPQPLVEFMANLLQNPSKKAISELYLFLEQNQLPITEDGYFIAYKMVKSDYMDIYTGKIRNMVGDEPEMPRAEVDDRRDNTCSQGLHFCSRSYLPEYSSSNRSTDRCMLVKVNPRDVVSIPSDYHNAKGRTCKYKVVDEVKINEWRDVLPKQDFTKKSVVTPTAGKLQVPGDWAKNHSIWDEFTFDPKINRWRSNLTGLLIKREIIESEFNLDTEDRLNLEAWASR
jgi:hypothetical protein